jgi:high affinity Mn2+ porin
MKKTATLGMALVWLVVAGCRQGHAQHASAAQAAQSASSQTADDKKQDEKPDRDTSADGEPVMMFKHPDDQPWYVAGQANIIFQAHPGFHSPYAGQNSFLGRGEYKTSLLGTVFLGYQPWHGFHKPEERQHLRYNTDLLLDIESAGGRGMSEALGIAGFTNLDVVRNPSLGSQPYIARVEVHQTIGFTDEMVENVRGPMSLATKVPVRRLDFRFGKMSLPDVVDANSILSDSHLQFMDWTVDNNGAWDYAADTRGYTYAATLEYQDRDWAVRYALALMPTVANGIDLDWNLHRSRGQNFEAEWRKSLIPGRKGTQRVLGFVNAAHMGNYREAVAAYLHGQDATPDITKHEHFDNSKYGLGYNFEQEVTDHFRVAGRFGWDDGKEESYAYTEVEQTVLIGGDYDGAQWGRKHDKAGLAFNSNAIKRDHQHYLQDGGLGFILGDGHLRYGRENILEGYYNLHATRGLFFALGGTHIDNPGYNRDRGPVWVASVRAHVDF